MSRLLNCMLAICKFSLESTLVGQLALTNTNSTVMSASEFGRSRFRDAGGGQRPP